MSEITKAFRSMAGDAANDVSDDNLALFIGNNYPQLLGDQEFNNEYNGAKWKSLGGWEGRKQDEKEISLWAKTKEAALTAGIGGLQGAAGLMKQAGGVAQSPLGWMAGPLAVTAKMIPGAPEKIADVGAEEQKRYAGLAAMRAGEGKIMQMVPELTAGTVQMMPALAASYFGNTKLGSMVGGMQSFGNMYKDAYDYYVANGASPQAAKWKAMGPATVSGLITAGIFEAGGKVGGPTKLMERFAKGEFSAQSLAQLIGGVLAGGGIGATLGGANTLAEDFLRQQTIEPDKDWKKIWHDVVMSAATTGIIGSAIGAGGGIRAYVKSKGAAAGTGEAPTTPPAQLDAQDRLIQRIESTRPEELPRLYEEIKRNTPEGQMQRLQAVLDEIKRRATQAEAAEKATKPQPETEATPEETAQAVTEYETRKRTEPESKLAEIETKIDELTGKIEKGFAKGMEPHPADAAELSRLMELKRLVTSEEPILSWEPLVEGEPISRSNLRIVAEDLRGRMETLMRQGKLDHRGETKLAVLDELVNNPNPTEEQFRNAANALEFRLDEKAARMPSGYEHLQPIPQPEIERPISEPGAYTVKVRHDAISRSNLKELAKRIYDNMTGILQSGKELTPEQISRRNILRKAGYTNNPSEESLQLAAKDLGVSIDDSAITFPRPYEWMNPAKMPEGITEIRIPSNEPKPGTEVKTTPTEQSVVEGVPEGGAVKPNVPSAETTGKATPTEGPVEPAKPTGKVTPGSEKHKESGERVSISYERFDEPTGEWIPVRLKGIITRNAKPGEKPWRLTAFNNFDEPFGHVDAASKTEAMSQKTATDLSLLQERNTRNVNIELSKEVIPSGEVQEKGPEVVRPAATTAEVLGTKPAVAPETTAAEPAPAAAPVEVPAGPQRYRIGKSPQTYVVEERLPKSDIEKANGEQPVRVRNEKTSEVSVVMESDLKPVETRVKTEGKKTGGASLDDQLREAGMDPSVFKSSKEKRQALIRAKAKEIFPGEGPIGVAIIGMNPRLLRFAYEKLNMARYNILNWIENMPGRRIVTSVFAGGEVAAHNYANQQGKHVELKLPNRLDRQGMAFVHESGGSLPLLRQWQAMIAGKSVLADKAIDHAINNFARLNSFRPWLKQLLDLQLQREINAGIDTNKLEDYISHYWDMDAMGPQGGFVLRRKGGGGLSTAFRQQRQFPNIATGIDKGAIPRSLDVAELVNARVRMGERLINRRLWIQSMQKINNVLDGEPLVVPWDKNTPNNYEMLDLGPGLQFGVNRDFAELFGALMAESQVRKSTLGNTLLMGAQGIKHGLLAFDLFHAARMMYKGASLGVKPTFREQNMKGLALLEYLPGDIDAAVNKGLITPEVRNNYNLWKDFTDVSVSKGLEVGRVSDAMYKDLTDSMHEVVAKMFGAHPDVIARYNVLSRYNKWLFEKFQRSIMVEANNYEAMRRLNNEPHIWDDLNKSTRDRFGRDATFEEKVKHVARVAKRNPNGYYAEIMRQTARDINVYFGNLGKQGLFKNATWQDLMRIGFLAPQWVEGMVTAELKGIGQAAKVPWDLATKRQFGVGTIAKGMGTGILAHMVLNQLINLVFRGQFTWQNEENKKGFLGNPPEWVNDNMSAWMPDLSGKSEGFKISPFSIFAEVAHDLIRFDVLERPQEALERIASNKASPLARAEKTFRTKMDWEGNRLTDTWDRAKATMWALAPTPIPISPLFQSKDMIGQKVQRQLTGSLGIKMEPVQGGEKGRARNEIASRLFNGKRFEDLDLPERARVLRQAERLYPNIEHPHRFRERIRTAEREEDILNTIKKNMDRGLVNALRDKGVNIKGMKPEVTMGGQSVYFTEDEEKEMVKTVAKNYDELLKRVQPRLAKMNLVQAQELADRAMSLAREKTVIQMRKSIRARTKQ